MANLNPLNHHEQPPAIKTPSNHEIIDYLPVLQVGSAFAHLGMMFRDVHHLRVKKDLSEHEVKQLNKSFKTHLKRFFIALIPIVSSIVFAIMDAMRYHKSVARLHFYEKYKDKIQVLNTKKEIEVFNQELWNNNEKLRNECLGINQELGQLTNLRLDLEAQIARYKAQIEAIKQYRAHLKHQNEDPSLLDELVQLREKATRYQNYIAKTQEQVSALRDRVGNLTHALDEKKQQIAQLQDHLNNSSDESQKLETSQEIQEKEEEARDLEDKLNQSIHEETTLSNQLVEQKQELLKLSQQSSQLQDSLNALQPRVSEIEKLTQQMARLEEELKEKESLIQKNNTLASQVVTNAQKIEELTQKLQEFSDIIQQKNKKIDELNTTLSQIQIDSAEFSYEDFSKDAEEVASQNTPAKPKIDQIAEQIEQKKREILEAKQNYFGLGQNNNEIRDESIDVNLEVNQNNTNQTNAHALTEDITNCLEHLVQDLENSDSMPNLVASTPLSKEEVSETLSSLKKFKITVLTKSSLENTEDKSDSETQEKNAADALSPTQESPGNLKDDGDVKHEAVADSDGSITPNALAQQLQAMKIANASKQEARILREGEKNFSAVQSIFPLDVKQRHLAILKKVCASKNSVEKAISHLKKFADKLKDHYGDYANMSLDGSIAEDPLFASIRTDLKENNGSIPEDVLISYVNYLGNIFSFLNHAYNHLPSNNSNNASMLSIMNNTLTGKFKDYSNPYVKFLEDLENGDINNNWEDDDGWGNEDHNPLLADLKPSPQKVEKQVATEPKKPAFKKALEELEALPPQNLNRAKQFTFNKNCKDFFDKIRIYNNGLPEKLSKLYPTSDSLPSDHEKLKEIIIKYRDELKTHITEVTYVRNNDIFKVTAEFLTAFDIK